MDRDGKIHMYVVIDNDSHKRMYRETIDSGLYASIRERVKKQLMKIIWTDDAKP